ncbi:MAG: YkgJ family cysteine cluster protein [Planctomycetales bacterium]|nr:YkgJ family cysteine cluster protein [Planctomycetales bacterium]
MSKPLPIVTAPGALQWDCQQCGICCRGAIVSLNDADLKRLASQNWQDHPDYAGRPVTARHGAGHRLAHREDGCCVFLDASGLCRIHAEHGYEAKPTMCRMFPLQLVPHQHEAILTLRCACPTAAVNHGTPLDEQRDHVRRLAQRGELPLTPVDTLRLKSGETRSWDGVQPILDALASSLTNPNMPLVRRLVVALQLANRIERANTARMDDDELRKCVPAWLEESQHAANQHFADRKRPGAGARALFRLIALDYLRLLPTHVTRESWGERLRLLRAATRMAWGGGSTPRLRCHLAPTKFSRLEEPLGPLPAEVSAPLSQLFENTANSALYAVASRAGWTVIESLRALAVSFPVGMWLLRWAHASATAEGGATPRQELSQELMLPIVVALDRGQGFAPLSGGQHRWRLWALQQFEAIEPLAIWYAS